ncbi:MAG: hypothetical protein IT285_04550 [Bdellovibrionales bacterium]|nr:hypothetical protein [Bdellovibrionales bacterium]
MIQISKAQGWAAGLTAITVAATAAPAMAAPSAADVAMWNRYCNRDGSVRINSAEIPKPNYTNALVKGVVAKLNHLDVSNESDEGAQRTFYFYGDIEKVYGVSSSPTGAKPAGTPADVNAVSAAFLTIACGEFRDNPKMLERKLKWAKDIVVVPEQRQDYDPSKPVWPQVTGPGYRKLLEMSETLYSLRQRELGAAANASHTLDQRVVDGITNCEYRYILKEYLAGDNELEAWGGPESFNAYKRGLAEFEAGDECSQDEKDHYIEFRGDGNFKAQSLESNAFIWNTRVFSKGCETPKKRKNVAGNILTDKDCENYFKAPWQSRYELTKQGALRLFFYPSTPEMERVMKAYQRGSGVLVLITEDLSGDGVADMVVIDRNQAGGRKVLELRAQAEGGNPATSAKLRKEIYGYILKAASEQITLPASYNAAVASLASATITSTDGIKLVTNVDSAWKPEYLSRPDKGLSLVFPDKAKAWDRLATVLDRHTDWYMIDMANLKIGFYQPTYSPWVASSYYIHESDAFTRPGYAMGQPGDGHRHWMYVQKVRKPNWFKAETMKADWPKNIDLLNTWFDETTFSRSGLGASEKAWDRFGSADHTEIEANLWLFESEE